jgi:hypothetical protein
MNSSNATFVYNYDRTDRFFVGAEDADLCQLTGAPLLPAFATFQAPPIDEIDGENIAVFVGEEEGWAVVPNNFWRPNFFRRPVSLGNQITGDLRIIQVPILKPGKYPGVPRVINGGTIHLAMSGRLAYMQSRLKEIEQLHNLRFSGLSVEAFHHFKYVSEDLIMQMKRLVDEIFVHEWLLLEGNSPEFLAGRKIRLQSVNEIDRLPPGPSKSAMEQLRSTDSVFFHTLRDLRNSFAHHLPVASSYHLVGAEFPTVNSMYARNGDLNNIELIEVYVEDLVKSFNRFVLSILSPTDQ